MTKPILLLGFLLIGISPTRAQENPWSIGLKGGATITSVTTSNRRYVNTTDRLRASPIQGYTGGLALQYLTEKNFGLQTEVNYVQKGWKEELFDSLIGERNPDRFYQVNLNYVEVPIMAHGYFGKRNLRLFLNLGLSFSYLLSYDTERSLPDITDEESDLIYQEIYQNKFDIGMRGGGGFEVVTSVGMFQLESDFTWGLNSILDKNITDIPNVVQNTTVAITLGYFVQF